jgi:hypothetical protein
MDRYRKILAVAAVILFFSGVDLYLFAADYTTITPRDWVTLFGVLLAPLAVQRLHRRHERFGKQLGLIVLWSIAYLTISFLWYGVMPSDGAVQELRDRLASVCFLGLAGFVFIMPESRRAAGIAAIVVVLITIVINGVELVQPAWFVMTVSTRASGLYGNSNQCGAALVIGMLIGSPLVPRRLRLSFYLLVGVGVAITFSRSTIIGWLIATATLLAFDSTRARARELVIGTVAAATLLVVLFQGVAASGLMDGFTLDDNLFDRVSFFRTLDASDDATQQRREVAAKAWAMFADRPVQGNGLASTLQWSDQGSTHNVFLSLMADHGVLGALILPALLLCVLHGRPGAANGPHWAFCAFVTWYALFSHNIFTERYQLLAFAFFAMGGNVGAQAVRGQLVRAFRSRVRATADSFQSTVPAR